MLRPVSNRHITRVCYGLCLLLSACTASESDKGLPVVNLDAAETRDVNLSALIDEARIIPLETRPECLVSYPQVWIANDFVLVGSFQLGVQRKPGRVFRFGLDGKFINEIGAGTVGKGPGGHLAEPMAIRYFEEEQLIQVNWGGKWRDPQLLDLSGDFVRDIYTPEAGYMDLQFAERLNDSIWFGSPFGIVGPNDFSPGDSSLLHFFTSDGRDVRTVPRLIFAAGERSIGMPPTPVHYREDDTWKFFVTGLDTLYRIEKMHLVPEVVFESENYLRHNTATKREDYDEKTMILGMTEGENYWILLRQIIRSPGGIAGDFEVPFILVDKQTLQATNIRLQDDVFQLLSGTFFGEHLNWTDGQKPFQGNLLYTIADADEVVELLKNRSGEVDPKMQRELDKLKGLEAEDNPVIFVFKLKESIEFSAGRV